MPPPVLDDSHLPRLQRRFPFKALNDIERDELRAEVSGILSSVDRLLQRVVNSTLPGYLRSHADDICQDLRMSLVTRSLPKFDTHAGAKLTTYLTRCAQWFTLSAVRRLNRQPRTVSYSNDHSAELIGPDTFADRAIEQLAADIFAEPQKYLGRTQGLVVQSRESDTDLGDRLGMQTASLATARYTARKAVKLLADDLPGI